MIAGFGLCLFYLVVTPLLPRLRREVFRHDLAAQPGHRRAGDADIAKAMALPNAMETWPTLAHPLANKVGWFDLNNINCGLLGMPLGFLVIYVVSLMTKEPSKEMQAFVDEIRKPRGRTVLKKRPDRQRDRSNVGGALTGPAFFSAPAATRLPTSAAAVIVESIRRATVVGGSNTLFTLLVLPPAEFHSGGADVHAARPRAARPDRRSRTPRTTSGGFSAGSPIRSSRWSRW